MMTSSGMECPSTRSNYVTSLLLYSLTGFLDIVTLVSPSILAPRVAFLFSSSFDQAVVSFVFRSCPCNTSLILFMCDLLADSIIRAIVHSPSSGRRTVIEG